MAFYYTSFDRYNEAGLDSYEFGTPDEIVNQYAANIIGNKFVVPMNGPLIKIDGRKSYFYLNSTYLGSPGYVKYIFSAPITLKNSYTRDEIDKFGPMDSSMFYLTESNIVYGVSKPSIHNLRVHPFKWGENKLMMAISLTYNVNNYVRTDDFILTYSFVNGKFVADGDLALPAIVYTKKYSKINMPNVTGFQAIIVKFD
jgi:hypothetical protein